jgi:hypothetical protein
MSVLAVALSSLAALAFARSALADAPPAELLTRVSSYSQTLKAMQKRASVTIDGRLEVCDGADRVQSVTTIAIRAEGRSGHPRFAVLRYTQNGVDKTRDLRAGVTTGPPIAARPMAASQWLRFPIAPRDQSLYRFDVVEVDRADPARIRIAFVPKQRADDTIEGSAWVDSRTGALLSAAFKLDKTPAFIDFVHVTIEFGASTPLGPAISRIRIEGAGGFLFFRKKFHGIATFSDYRIAAP